MNIFLVLAQPLYLYSPRLYMLALRLVPCGTNLFLIKKTNVSDLEGVHLSAFTGCQLPFFCSTAAQCEAAAAAVCDLGALVLCKAAALLVVEHGSDATFLQYQVNRRRQVHKICTALFLRVVFFALAHVFVCAVDGGSETGMRNFSVSSHNKRCVS